MPEMADLPNPGGNTDRVDLFVGDWSSITGSYKLSQCAIERLDVLSKSALEIHVTKSSSTTADMEVVYGGSGCLLVGKTGSGTQFLADHGQVCDLGYEAIEVESAFITAQPQGTRSEIHMFGVGTVKRCIHELTGNLAKN